MLKLLDPALTFLIATIICCSTYPLFIQSVDILMENCPKDIDYGEFREHLEEGLMKFGKIITLEDLHIWQLNSEKGLASLKVLIDTGGSNEINCYQDIVKYLNEEFQNNGIQKVTIQPEFVIYENSDSGLDS